MFIRITISSSHVKHEFRMPTARDRIGFTSRESDLPEVPGVSSEGGALGHVLPRNETTHGLALMKLSSLFRWYASVFHCDPYGPVSVLHGVGGNAGTVTSESQ